MKHVEIEIEIAGSSGSITDLVVIALRGEERIGAPYTFDLTVVRKGSYEPYDLDEIVASPAKLRFVERDGAESEVVRWVHARVAHVQSSLDTPPSTEPTYELRLEPKIAALARFSSQEIFVGSTVPQIIETKLSAANFGREDFALRFLATYPDTDAAPAPDTQGRLTVQYRESDLAFISRLAENIGISFFFEADAQDEKIIFTDHTSGFVQERELPFVGAGEHGVRGLTRRLASVRSDFYVYDYNYRTPLLTYERDGALLFDVLGGEAHLDVPSAGATVEYAPNAKTPDEASRLARIRAEEEESTRELISGHGADARIIAGHRLTIRGTPHWGDNEALVVVSNTHDYKAPSFGGGSGEHLYQSDFVAVRANKTGPDGQPLTFRPARSTPKPRIHGVLTAVIHPAMEGQSTEMQHLDAQGRYIIKLHFDPSTKIMPRTRMAQPHAGVSYGHHFPLRPGCEVLISFVDGDPDRPIIVGSIANPAEPSPVVRPGTSDPIEISRIRTRAGVLIEISDGLPDPSSSRN